MSSLFRIKILVPGISCGLIENEAYPHYDKGEGGVEQKNQKYSPCENEFNLREGEQKTL